MGVRTAVQPQQLGQIGGSVEIAADALADEVALTAERDDRPSLRKGSCSSGSLSSTSTAGTPQRRSASRMATL